MEQPAAHPCEPLGSAYRAHLLSRVAIRGGGLGTDGTGLLLHSNGGLTWSEGRPVSLPDVGGAHAGEGCAHSPTGLGTHFSLEVFSTGSRRR
jgi:hypothetical protein